MLEDNDYRRITQITNGGVRMEEFAHSGWKLEALIYHTDGTIYLQYFENYAKNDPPIEHEVTAAQAAQLRRRWGEMQMQAIAKELAA